MAVPVPGSSRVPRLGGGFPGSFFGSAGERYAATRRATRVTRNTWPVSASMTAMAQLPFPVAVKSPYPRVVNVVKLKYWNVWVLAGWPLAKNGAPPRCWMAE